MENINTNTLIVGLLGVIIGFIVGISLGGTDLGGRVMNMMDFGGFRGGMMDEVDMEEVMRGMTGGLGGLSGDAFDRAFIAGMIVHHEGAVEMAEAARTNAKHDEIKQMAEDIISAQTREIAQMRGWQRDWYGE